MKNKVIVKHLNRQYSEITVEKECGCDNGKICCGMSLIERPIYEECFNCKGTGKIITKHIVNNTEYKGCGLEYWIKYFENKVDK